VSGAHVWRRNPPCARRCNEESLLNSVHCAVRFFLPDLRIRTQGWDNLVGKQELTLSLTVSFLRMHSAPRCRKTTSPICPSPAATPTRGMSQLAASQLCSSPPGGRSFTDPRTSPCKNMLQDRHRVLWTSLKVQLTR